MRCDACGGHGATPVLESGDRRFGLGGRFAVVRCDGCGLVRTDPRPEDLGAHYPAGDYYSFRPPAEPTARERARVRGAYGLNGVPRAERALAALGRDRLMPGLPPGPPGDVLDVGCGSGEFLLALREAGWRPHGIEISEPAVEAARAAGLDGVRCGDLLEAGYGEESFDAVRFWHSLEHVPSPRAQLTEAARVLRPGGSLTIGVPNFGSFLARRTGERWYYLDLPRHLHHFEPETLSRLVADCGLRVTRVRTMSGSTALLGTFAYLLGRSEELVGKRGAWYAALPVAAALDAAGRGDALELTAVRTG
jgi:SAM-dependent methyltransferase